MEEKALRQLLEEKGQTQLLQWWGELDANGREKLARQIACIDWEQLSRPASVGARGKIAPIEGLSVEEIAARRAEFAAVGQAALRAGKAAAVLLAGGQGTRLGSDAPKGTFNIGITRPLYIFEQLIRNLTEVTNACNARIPLLIMTSEKNDEETRAFFASHEYFGYPREDIFFFRQAMSPCVGLNGKILLEAKDALASSPNGNGGWYASLERAGLAEKMRARGVAWYNVFAVDNVLQRICDPVFLGATILSGKASGAKVVQKAAPRERVGVLCLEDGLPAVVEYYEIDDAMATLRAADGKLLYRYGVILNYLFRADVLERIARERLPLHAAKKKIPYLAPDGTFVEPAEENGYKFETLILDMVRCAGSCLPFEVVREREFAPIKNRTGVDSVESARELLKQNGVEL